MTADTSSSTLETEIPMTDSSSDSPEVASAATSDQDPAEAKIKSLQDQLLRLQADFENFRKRVESEKADLYKYGAERTINQLLPVLDNLQRGSASLSEASDAKLLYQSFKMLQTQLLDSLSSQGLKRVEAVGQPFDPFFHEAIQREHSAEHPENIVTIEHQAGYLLHDRVIRPSMVVVSAGPADGADENGNPFQG